MTGDPRDIAPARALADQPRPQCGVIAYRRTPDLDVMLLTSRETGRWVIPKGGRMWDRTAQETAATEAYEEAGVVGDVAPIPLGTYDYVKYLKSGEGVACRVTVFAMAVTAQLDQWPEQDQRTTRWFAGAESAEQVHEPDLAALIRAFCAAGGPAAA